MSDETPTRATPYTFLTDIETIGKTLGLVVGDNRDARAALERIRLNATAAYERLARAHDEADRYQLRALAAEGRVKDLEHAMTPPCARCDRKAVTAGGPNDEHLCAAHADEVLMVKCPDCGAMLERGTAKLDFHVCG